MVQHGHHGELFDGEAGEVRVAGREELLRVTAQVRLAGLLVGRPRCGGAEVVHYF